MTEFDWYKPCAYDDDQKRRFHREAKKRLKALAAELGFKFQDYDLRTNAGGIAVSGEITLHEARLYVQVCQPATGWDSGILIRGCEGRKDYTGGPNHFAPLCWLDDIPQLAYRCRATIGRGKRPWIIGEGVRS
jgi:hypothetical protein